MAAARRPSFFRSVITLGNIIWFVLAGWWLAIMHITAAAALAITIIGIPFAWAHVKLALASLFPGERRWWRLTS